MRAYVCGGCRLAPDGVEVAELVVVAFPAEVVTLA